MFTVRMVCTERNPFVVKRLSILFLLSLLLGACTEALLPGNDTSISLETLDEGRFLVPGSEITVGLTWDKNGVEPDTFRIELYDAAGQPYGEPVEFGRENMADSDRPALILPADITPGEYTIVYTILSGDEVLLSESRGFFVVTGNYALFSAQIFPSEISAGGDGYFVVSHREPQGDDPWFRWSIDGYEVMVAPLSAGGDHLQWRAPDSIGYYHLEVEMFPVEPTSDLVSTVSVSTEILVDVAQSPEPWDFAPEDSYRSLFHLTGNLDGSGFADAPTPAEFDGDRLFEPFDGESAYRFSGSNSLNAQGFGLPLVQGELAPFTLGLRLVADQTVGTLVSWGDAARLGFDSSGRLYFELYGGAIRSVLADKIDTAGVLQLNVSFAPGTESDRVTWYVDGQRVFDQQFSAFSGVLTGTGDTIIGDGFVGLITEFGVYTRDAQGNDSVDTAVYRRYQERNFGPALIFAEGFDAPTWTSANGDQWVAQRGALPLEDGAEVEILDVDLSRGGIEIALAGSGSATLILDSEKGRVSMDTDLDGQDIHVLLDGGLVVDGQRLLTGVADDFSKVTISFASSEAAVLDAVRVVYRDPQLSEAEPESEDDPLL